LPFARASIELCNVLCDIIKVGEPRELHLIFLVLCTQYMYYHTLAAADDGYTYYPMFFTQERPFEEFYSNTIPTFNKTWREMRATAADFSKVCCYAAHNSMSIHWLQVLSVVREQITRSLSDQPASFDSFRTKLGKLSYSEITKIWEMERYHHEESESQAKPIVLVAFVSILRLLILSLFTENSEKKSNLKSWS
jgi:engulfment/cell motility protein 1